MGSILMIAAPRPHFTAPSISLPSIPTPSISMPQGAADALADFDMPFVKSYMMIRQSYLEEEAARTRAEIETYKKEVGVSRVLYHYTDVSGAIGIQMSQEIIASEVYRGNFRPSGAYATDIPPFDVRYTQEDLRDMFSRRDVSYCVIVADDDGQFQNLGSNAWVIRAPAGTPVPVNVVHWVKTPLEEYARWDDTK
jgi:hypothetical protein